MMSAGPFVAGLKCSGNVFLAFSSFACGTLQFIEIHLITLHNILEYMQIAIIQTEAADFEHLYLCHSQNVWPRLYMAHGNQVRVVYGDRWDGLRVARIKELMFGNVLSLCDCCIEVPCTLNLYVKCVYM